MAMTWTPEQLQFLTENLERMSYTELAAHFGVTRNVIAGIISRRKLTRTQKRLETYEVLKNNILALWPTHTTAAISRKLGIPFTKITTIAKKIGLMQVKTRKNKPINLAKKKEFKALTLVVQDIKGMSMITARPSQCHWVIGEPKHLICCGQPVKLGKPYCLSHEHLAHHEPPK